MQSDRILKLIEQTRKELDSLEYETRRAASVQWERSPTTQDDPSEIRSRGGHRDPTGDTATDPKRLSVRRALVDADRDMRRVYTVLRATTGRVRHATGRWGEPS